MLGALSILPDVKAESKTVPSLNSGFTELVEYCDLFLLYQTLPVKKYTLETSLCIFVTNLVIFNWKLI